MPRACAGAILMEVENPLTGRIGPSPDKHLFLRREPFTAVNGIGPKRRQTGEQGDHEKKRFNANLA
jgi:hypothetical protein